MKTLSFSEHLSARRCLIGQVVPLEINSFYNITTHPYNHPFPCFCCHVSRCSREHNDKTRGTIEPPIPRTATPCIDHETVKRTEWLFLLCFRDEACARCWMVNINGSFFSQTTIQHAQHTSYTRPKRHAARNNRSVGTVGHHYTRSGCGVLIFPTRRYRRWRCFRSRVSMFWSTSPIVCVLSSLSFFTVNWNHLDGSPPLFTAEAEEALRLSWRNSPQPSNERRFLGGWVDGIDFPLPHSLSAGDSMYRMDAARRGWVLIKFHSLDKDEIFMFTLVTGPLLIECVRSRKLANSLVYAWLTISLKLWQEP